jgi:hypothetical protein
MSKMLPLERHGEMHIRERINRSDAMLRDSWENPLTCVVSTVLASTVDIGAGLCERAAKGSVQILGKIGLKFS